MRVCGVVAEYNPFHNGHRYQLERIRESGFDGIVAVMSGNVVQRGDFAVADKHIRTEQALKNGVDLVVELPLPFVLSSAERFSFGAVCTLDSLGVVDSLCFGSECGNIAKLNRIALLEIESNIKDYTLQGVTYAAALSKLVENELGKDYSDILSSPNNVLGIEYIRALKKLNSNITAFTVKRNGAGHFDAETKDGFCSAEYIRKNLDKKNISDYMPASSFEVLLKAVKNGEAPVSLVNNEKAVLALLRMKNSEYFKNIQFVSEGIENRLSSSVKDACTLDELYSFLKTKRYTMSRVKRLVMNALLDVTEEYSHILPPYIRVLGFNEKGREILKNAKLTASKPIYTLCSDFNDADSVSKMLYSLECKATDLFNCFTPETKSCSREQTRNAVILK